MYEEDSGLMQWGLRLLDGDPGSHPEYYGDLTQHDADIYHGQCLSDHYDMESGSVENDEIIAHTLQEELSQLAVTEAPESSYAEERQEWPSPSRNYYSGRLEGAPAAASFFIFFIFFGVCARAWFGQLVYFF